MGTVHGRILVIDDDPFMLKAICDLLQRAGFQVVTRESPLGATQVILGERIDAAVIDWNLPAINGDEVVRLLRTWDDVKDLPVLIITGAPSDTVRRIKRELPGVKVLSKEQLRQQLVSELGSVVGSNKTVRGVAPIRLGPNGEFEMAPQPRAKALDLVPGLLARLAATMPLAGSVWTDATHGHREGVEPLVQELDMLAGQARLLALEEAATLLQALTDTLRVLPGEPVSPEVQCAVEDGMAALSSLPETGSGAFTMPPEPLISALRRARDELAGHA